MYSVMELKYFNALLMSLEPFSTSRALFRMILSLIEVIASCVLLKVFSYL